MPKNIRQGAPQGTLGVACGLVLCPPFLPFLCLVLPLLPPFASSLPSFLLGGGVLEHGVRTPSEKHGRAQKYKKTYTTVDVISADSAIPGFKYIILN